MVALQQAHATPTSNAYWVIPGRLLAGEHPLLVDREPLERRMQRFLNANIQLFIDLTDSEESAELGDYLQLLDRQHGVAPIARCHVPVRDMNTPCPLQMSAILTTIDSALRLGQTVYVHCWGGLGRTGTVIGCYLVHHGRTGHDALREIARLRSDTRDCRAPAPSTDAQRQMVLGWRRLH